MYEGVAESKVDLPVYINSDFLIGPEGAHLNISGISGLATKTSYAIIISCSSCCSFIRSP